MSATMMGTTTGAAPDSSRGIGATAATGAAGPEGSGEMALAGVRAALRLDLIVLRRRGPLLLLPLALALFIAMDVLAGRLQTTVMAGVALGLCAQYAHRHHMHIRRTQRRISCFNLHHPRQYRGDFHISQLDPVFLCKINRFHFIH